MRQLDAGPPIPDQQKPLVRPFHFNSKSNKQFREMVDVRHPNHSLCVMVVVILALSAFYRRWHRSIPRNTPVQSRQDGVTVITKELLGTTPLVTFTGPSSYKRESDVEAGDRGCLEETGTEEGRTSNPTTLSSLDENYVHLACPICAEAFADGGI